MIKTNHKFFIGIGMVVLFCLCILAIIHINIKNKVEEKIYNIEPIIKNGLVLFLDSPRMLFEGEIRDGDFAPFLHEGLMFAPIDEIAKYLGATFKLDANTKVVTIESNGYSTHFMLDFNVIIFNSEPMIMKSKPVEKDNHIYLPIDIIATSLNVPCFRDYSQGIAVFRGTKALEEDDYIALAKQLQLKVKKNGVNKELDELNKDLKLYDIYQISRDGRLYLSDENAKLFKWTLLDDFSLVKEEQEIVQDFTANTAYMVGEGANKNNLYIVGTDTIFSPVPEVIIRNDLIYAMSRFIELKIANDVSQNRSIYLAALKGDTGIPFKDLKDKDTASGFYDSVVFAKGTTEISAEFALGWRDICSKAKSGDILLFRNKESNDRYGYFNHAALILDVSTQTDEIHVLQARSSELGVGADSSIDYLKLDSFKDDSYWNKNDIVVLCSVNGMDSEIGLEVAATAYEHFKDYSFGYGGFYGAKQTTCVELINNALKLKDIVLISDNEYKSKLKSALDGNVANLILLPDDIAVSDKVEIITYVERQ